MARKPRTPQKASVPRWYPGADIPMRVIRQFAREVAERFQPDKIIRYFMKRLTKEWVQKTEADRVVARQSSRSKIPLHDGVCFHAQQTAEKYLKAVMEEQGLAIAHP